MTCSPQIATPDLTLGRPLDADAMRRIERALNLEHGKWDTRLGGASTLSSQPVFIQESDWNSLCACAEKLAQETEALEAEVCRRTELYPQLGIPKPLRQCLASTDWPQPSPVRVMRFDFHPTRHGWAVSEVNSDVPGGYGEATFLPQLFAPFCGCLRLPPSPLEAWGEAMQSALSGGSVVFLSAPGYLEDHQVVRTLMWELTGRRIACDWIQSPAAIEWHAGKPRLPHRPATEVGGIVRFYQAEWLCKLPARTNWRSLMSYAGPMTNPAISVLAESKRFPLLWSQLRTPAAAWRSVLPECCEPDAAEVARREEWVLKAAYSNTGDSVRIGNAMTAREWDDALRTARRQRAGWVAQRRFDTTPLDSVNGLVYPCVGIFVINRRAAGAYIRLSRQQLTDGLALEAPLFIQGDEEGRR